MKAIDYWFDDGGNMSFEDRFSPSPATEDTGVAVLEDESEPGVDEDYFIGSSGLTPIQELACTLELTNLD